jgi:hypothetical protein
MKWWKVVLMLSGVGGRLSWANTNDQCSTTFDGTVQVRLFGHARKIVDIPLALGSIEQYWTRGRREIFSQVTHCPISLCT